MAFTTDAWASQHIVVKDMPTVLRPRERMAFEGPERLAESELIAIILRTGTRGVNSLRLAEKLIARYENIGRLGEASMEELAEVEGIGIAKAAQVLAAVELGKRVIQEKSGRNPVLSSPEEAAEFLMPKMRYLETEHFKALLVDIKNKLIRQLDISIGGLNSAVVHPRELYKAAVRLNAAGVIAAHNHPSGDPTPSREDIVLTRRLTEAGRILGIEFIDHIIIGDGSWLSLREKGFLSS